MSTLTYGHQTDVGRLRKKNQDSFAIVTPEALGGRVDGLFVVADGMGGHAGGEIASRVTAETIPAVVEEVLAEAGGPPTPIAMVEALREAIASANEAVWKQGRANPELRGMGTTCVALLVRDGQAAVGNVGDSRIYLLRQGKLIQLTQDHSLVQEHVRTGDLSQEEARGSRFRNVITRAIGIASQVAPDVDLVELEEGDTLLLCTDGLTNMVQEPHIARLLRTAPRAQDACEQLVAAANDNGGEDNITAVVVRHGAFTPDSPRDAEDYDKADDIYPAESNGVGHVHSRNRRGVSIHPLFLLLVLVLLFFLGAVLGNVGRQRYEVVGSWPFVRAIRPIPTAVKPPAAPPIDFGSLVYGPPTLVSTTPVRGAPLVCDAAGNVYALTKQMGMIVRIAPDGKASGDFPVTPAAESRPQDTHWAADVQGYLYLCSKSGHAILRFNPQGTRVGLIGKKELKAPEGIAVDGSGSIYVVDQGKLLVFRAHPPTRAGGDLQAPEHPNTRIPEHPNTRLPDRARRRSLPLSVEDPHGTQ